jgi:hypothetical protein
MVIFLIDPERSCINPEPPQSFRQQAKNKKNLDFHYFVTFLDFLSMKTDVNVPSKVISKNT